MLDAGNDFIGRLAAGLHEGVGHARHGRMGVTLAAAVAGWRHIHEPGILAIMQITHQDAVLDQHRSLGRRSFIVDGERTPAGRQGAVVDHGDAGRGDPLAHQAGKGGRLLAVEVTLEAVADSFVQQDSGPARSQHNRHFAGRSRARVEIDQRLAQGFVDLGLPVFRRHIGMVAATAADALRARLHALPLARHDRDVEPHERSDIADHDTALAHDHHRLPLAAQ